MREKASALDRPDLRHRRRPEHRTPIHGLPTRGQLPTSELVPPALFEPTARLGLGLPFSKRLCLLGVRDLLVLFLRIYS